MFGQNPIRSQDLSSPDALYIQEIFTTIQGEGPFAGTPALFIRLAGCNLKCKWCDTQFEEGMNKPTWTVKEVLARTANLCSDKKISLVVLTGGEPLRQDISALISGLLESFSHVQIETAGTLWIPGLMPLINPGAVSLVCSPKTPKIHYWVMDSCRNWKYIIKSGETSLEDGLPEVSSQTDIKQRLYRPIRSTDAIWVQACDEKDSEKNKANLEETIRIALKYNYRISYQMHKIMGLP